MYIKAVNFSGDAVAYYSELALTYTEASYKGLHLKLDDIVEICYSTKNSKRQYAKAQIQDIFQRFDDQGNRFLWLFIRYLDKNGKASEKIDEAPIGSVNQLVKKA